MKHSDTREVLTVSKKMLKFANLPKANSATEVNEILRPERIVVYWNDVESNKKTMDGIAELHRKTRQRLNAIVTYKKFERRKILRELVNEISDANFWIKISVPNTAKPIRIDLPFLPKIGIGKDDQLTVSTKEWVITGAHIAVILGLVEIFVNGLADRLNRCRRCEKYYFSAPRFKVSYDPQCYKELRREKAITLIYRKRREQKLKHSRHAKNDNGRSTLATRR